MIVVVLVDVDIDVDVVVIIITVVVAVLFFIVIVVVVVAVVITIACIIVSSQLYVINPPYPSNLQICSIPRNKFHRKIISPFSKFSTFFPHNLLFFHFAFTTL